VRDVADMAQGSRKLTLVPIDLVGEKQESLSVIAERAYDAWAAIH
jgi:hypothetical protein